MSTPNARKGYELHRAVVQSADPVTGITQVKIPDLLGSRLVDVHWVGLEKVGGLYQTPNPGDMSMVAVSNDGTQIMWVLSADHSALWNGIDTAQVAIADLQADLALVQADLALAQADIDALTSSLSVVAAGVVQNTDDIAAIQSAMVSTITGTAFEVDVVRTGASVALSFPTNVVKSGTGYFRVTNTGVSATAASVSRLEMGVVSGAPRIVFEDSGSATVWVVDNLTGTLRLFNGGAEKYNFTNSALTTTGSIGVVAGGTVQGTQLISTVAAGTSPLTVTSPTAVTNLNADLLDGNHIILSTTAPTISTNPGLGTGYAHSATWMYIGPTTTGSTGFLTMNGAIALGTSPTMGDLRITLPNGFEVSGYTAQGLRRIGIVGYRVATVGYTGALRMESTTVARFIVNNTGTASNQDTAITSGVPATWAANDSIAYTVNTLVVHP